MVSHIQFFWGAIGDANRAIELLDCWGGGFVKGCSGVLWQPILPCIVVGHYTLHIERAFKGLEQSMTEPKLTF